ncbi:MAG TPA: YciI family protein [Ramlibacter sp.]|nr:YciI family protein [Ramlibacter sp.]
MLWAIYAVDKPNSAPLREKYVKEHVQYFTDNQDAIFVSGPQQTDDAAANIGSIFIISANSRTEAQTFLEKEPLYRAGIFESVRVTRMRRGRFFNPSLGDNS